MTGGSVLDPARDQQDDNDENDQAESPAGVVAPVRAIRPHGQGTDQQENKYNQ